MKTTPELIFFATLKGATIPIGIDTVVMDAHGVQRTRLLGDTIEQARVRYPGAQVCTIDQLIEMQANEMRSEPQMTTAEAFREAFEILPPAGWQNLGTFECFRMSERIDGSMVRIYARVKDTYWTFIDRIDMPVQAIMGRIEAKLRQMVTA